MSCLQQSECSMVSFVTFLYTLFFVVIFFTRFNFCRRIIVVICKYVHFADVHCLFTLWLCVCAKNGCHLEPNTTETQTIDIICRTYALYRKIFYVSSFNMPLIYISSMFFYVLRHISNTYSVFGSLILSHSFLHSPSFASILSLDFMQSTPYVSMVFLLYIDSFHCEANENETARSKNDKTKQHRLRNRNAQLYLPFKHIH